MLVLVHRLLTFHSYNPDMSSFTSHSKFRSSFALFILALVSIGASAADIPSAPFLLSQPGPTFSVPDSELPKTLSLIVYGDMRFTDPVNTKAANPQARRLLVDKIATERPDAVLLTGDVPYADTARDYDDYRAETVPWKTMKVRIYPALGNHELHSDPHVGLKNWWTAFPELNNRRWYSVQLGKHIYLINIDSNDDLTEGSRQMLWLQGQVAHLSKSVRFVFIGLHHPPVADIQTRSEVDHNPRPNEIALRDYLSKAARKSRAQFVVVSGHIHNYERFEVAGVTYLVSGGGGARPYEIDRTSADLYQGSETVNFHYIRFDLDGRQLRGTMTRLADPAAAAPEWQVKDRFVITAR